MRELAFERKRVGPEIARDDKCSRLATDQARALADRIDSRRPSSATLGEEKIGHGHALLLLQLSGPRLPHGAPGDRHARGLSTAEAASGRRDDAAGQLLILAWRAEHVPAPSDLEDPRVASRDLVQHDRVLAVHVENLSLPGRERHVRHAGLHVCHGADGGRLLQRGRHRHLGLDHAVASHADLAAVSAQQRLAVDAQHVERIHVIRIAPAAVEAVNLQEVVLRGQPGPPRQHLESLLQRNRLARPAPVAARKGIVRDLADEIHRRLDLHRVPRPKRLADAERIEIEAELAREPNVSTIVQHVGAFVQQIDGQASVRLFELLARPEDLERTHHGPRSATSHELVEAVQHEELEDRLGGRADPAQGVQLSPGRVPDPPAECLAHVLHPLLPARGRIVLGEVTAAGVDVQHVPHTVAARVGPGVVVLRVVEILVLEQLVSDEQALLVREQRALLDHVEHTVHEVRAVVVVLDQWVHRVIERVVRSIGDRDAFRVWHGHGFEVVEILLLAGRVIQHAGDADRVPAEER